MSENNSNNKKKTMTAEELGKKNSVNDLAGKKLVEIYKEGK